MGDYFAVSVKNQKELSAFIQERAFASGRRWGSLVSLQTTEGQVQHISQPFLVFRHSDKYITYRENECKFSGFCRKMGVDVPILSVVECLDELEKRTPQIMIGEYGVEVLGEETIKVGCQIVTKAQIREIAELFFDVGEKS